MKGTSGPPSSISSGSAALNTCLVSRLQTLLGTAGSMEYRQTWKEKTTPAGRRYWAHTASAHPTSGSGCTGWVSPTAQDGSRGSLPPRPQDTGIPLSQQATLAGRATPDANAMNLGEGLETWDARQLKNKEKHKNGRAAMPIAIQAQMVVGWASLRASDPNCGNTYTEKCEGKDLTKDANLVFGQPPTSSPAETEKRGALNPAHSRWLMGYPAEWDSCGAMAMQSFPKSRRSSSKQALKQLTNKCPPDFHHHTMTVYITK